MKNLQEKVQSMLNGEKKRREIATRFLNEVEEILLPAAEDIWGKHYDGDSYTDAVYLTKKDKEGKISRTDIYFRWKSIGNNFGYNEYSGFYTEEGNGIPAGGISITEHRGADFWYAIQVIIDWIPQVIEAMEKRNISREQLLSKINITA